MKVSFFITQLGNDNVVRRYTDEENGYLRADFVCNFGKRKADAKAFLADIKAGRIDGDRIDKMIYDYEPKTTYRYDAATRQLLKHKEDPYEGQPDIFADFFEDKR